MKAQIHISDIKQKGEDKCVQEERKSTPKNWPVDMQFASYKLGSKSKGSFYGELHMMLKAGMDIRSALDIYATEMASKKDKALFIKIKESVVEGTPLSLTLRNEKIFGKYEYQNIRIGEESGNLINVLGELSNYFKARLEQRRLIIGALSYPCLVLLTSLGAVGFMLQVVVPMFEDVFSRFGGQLPWMTRMVIRASEIFSDNFLLLLVVVIIGLAIGYLMKGNRKLRLISGKIALSVPVFGDIVRASALARFSSAMHLLISSKYPLVQSLKLVKEMIQFYPIEISLNKAEKGIVMGKSLNAMLSEDLIYPRKMIALIKMGEEVNKLDAVFLQIKEQYDAEVKHRSAILANVLEPILIIFIGAAVGFILISMYLPLFEMSTGLG